MKNNVDRATMGVLAVYVTQMEGRPTIAEIQETITGKVGYKCLKRDVKNAVLSVKKRGLLSVNSDVEDGVLEERFSIKDVRWSNPPEMAHLKTNLPKLLETEEAKQIQDMMEGIHLDGNKKGGRLPDIRDYVTYKVTFKNIVPILGGEPGDKLTFRRNNGSIWLTTNMWVRAALRNKLRMKNVTTSKVQYIEADDVFINKDSIKLYFIPRPQPPSRPGQGGTGIKDYEAIPEGFTFALNISFPTTGFGIKEEEFISCLDGIRIGARHREYGLLKLLKAEKC